MSGRTLYVARREDADPNQVLCGLAASSGSSAPRLLPRDEQNADLVLAVADGTPRDPLARLRSPLQAAAGMLRGLVWHRLGLGFAGLFAVLVAGFVLLVAGAGYRWDNALYLTVLDTAGAALTNPALGGSEKVAQFILTFDGMVFVPFATAVIVGARLTGSIRENRPSASGHVIVVGLGRVGMRVVGQLHDLGIGVVGIDRDPEAAGVAFTRRLGVHVVVGEIHREETLRAANLKSSIALVSVTSSDEVNLEAALHARALRGDLRIVLRLYDDDLAERVQKMIGNTVSRSVSYLAAPAFAAAMLEHQVLRTIPVGLARAAHRGRPGAGGDRSGRAAGRGGRTARRDARPRGTPARHRPVQLVAGPHLPACPAGPAARPGHPGRAGRDAGQEQAGRPVNGLTITQNGAAKKGENVTVPGGKHAVWGIADEGLTALRSVQITSGSHDPGGARK